MKERKEFVLKCFESLYLNVILCDPFNTMKLEFFSLRTSGAGEETYPRKNQVHTALLQLEIAAPGPPPPLPAPTPAPWAESWSSNFDLLGAGISHLFPVFS